MFERTSEMMACFWEICSSRSDFIDCIIYRIPLWQYE
jgi:hypothetical protein